MVNILISESVSLGHPDKIADYISSYLLDRFLEQDSFVRYALEVQIKDNFVTLGGEITSSATIDFDKEVKNAIESIGYTKEYADIWGHDNVLCADSVVVNKYISQQSPDISQGVDSSGWGDQGIMFGMAVNIPETNYMPLDIFLAKDICNKLFEVNLGGLDIKSQVVVKDRNVEKIIVAIPLLDGDISKVKNLILNSYYGNYELIINGTGKYVKHSSMGDCGTTGRKLAVDFYGGNCNIGGGSPWTKDGTKADLTLNMYARELALDYVKKHNIDMVKCLIGCCIGKSTIDVVLFDKHNNVLENYKQTSNVLYMQHIEHNQNTHPHEKGLSILETLLQVATKKNDIVLDCFSGSGSLALACYNLSRQFICIEMAEKWFNLSTKRLEDHKKQGNLFLNSNDNKKQEQISMFDNKEAA